MRILHVFRTPLGGLFRHVRDMARGQQELGHEAGLLCDSLTGGESAVTLLKSAEEFCALGIKRIPISRLPGIGDLSGARQTLAHARALKADIVHCHGAKGGVYGRLAGWRLGLPTVYTPHGGSLHYQWRTPLGFVFLTAEWLLARLGGGYQFVCDFERREFGKKIGLGRNRWRVNHNGLWPEELELAKPSQDAADILFIGELRDLKGVDLLIEAIKLLKEQRPISAVLVGDGPDEQRYRTMAEALGLKDNVTFAGRLPAREALRRGRVLVIPSRNESFPYVVLEAMAAGVPVLASNAGGIAEALSSECLFPKLDAPAIASCVAKALDEPARAVTNAMANREKIRSEFSAARMARDTISFYSELTRR